MKYFKLIMLYFYKFKWLDFLFNFSLFNLYKVNYDKFPIINGRIHLSANGAFFIGKGAQFNSGKNYNPIGGDTILRFIICENAKLIIGRNVGISNSTIFCQDSITIEDNVLIGGSCKIYDTDFHAIQQLDRITAFLDKVFDTKAKTSKVIIKKGAWIGGHCLILKGVTVGENSIIGAGSVVSKDIPDNEIWAGNPIKFIKKI